jgi:hypothetical protein
MSAPFRVLFVDIGTVGGWAVWHDGEHVASGKHIYPTEGHPGARPAEAIRHFVELIDEYEPSVVAYEMVRRHTGTQAAHVYGALLGALETVACWRRVSMHSSEVGALKARAGVERPKTPKGKTPKAKGARSRELKRRMVVACTDKLGVNCIDDNQAEANWGAVVTGEVMRGWRVPDLMAPGLPL